MKTHVTINGVTLPFREGVAKLRDAAERARAQNAPKNAAELLTIAANFLYDGGCRDEAIEQLQRAEVLWRETCDLALVGECLGLKAVWLHEAEQSGAALEALRELASIDRKLGSDKLEVTLEQEFGVLYDLGDREAMKKVADEFFLVATDAQAIWRIRRRLTHFGIDGGEEAAETRPYDVAQDMRDGVQRLTEQRQWAQDLLKHAATTLETGDYSEALTDATRAIELDPDTWLGPFLQGQARFGLGEYAACVEALDRALALNDREAQAWWLKGHALSYLGLRTPLGN